MSTILDRLMKGLPFGKKPLTYEQEKELARHDDSKVREKLAAREDIRPEILYYLAEDAEPVVRREIAANRRTPLQADLLLAKDSDEDVRCHLAQKIGDLMPDLSADDTERLSQYALSVLEILVRDQVTRVRVILAETLKDIANAPPHVIQQLARDTKIEVAGPVLRYSPLLSDDDLLEIIKAGPVKGALVKIAQRSELRESISDAIVAVDERDAITALLGNESAQIREETLDELISRAPGIKDWHVPLTKRPHLSFKAAQAVASFVADSLLDNMRGRSDLDPEMLHMVEDEVHRRLLGSDGDSPVKKRGGKGTAAAQAPSEAQDTERAEKARHMRDAGELNEKALTDSLKEGDHHFVASALSVLSKMSLKIVRGIVKSKNAWAMTALIRKAGLGMDFAMKCQKDLADISEQEIIRPDENGDFPMSREEEEATLDSFAEEISEEEVESTQDRRNGEGDADPRSEAERLADPDWEKSGKTAGGPVDPDWAESGAKPGQKGGVADLDWEEGGAKPGQKGGMADPDWAEGGEKPGQKGGVADLDWEEGGAKPKADDEFLEPDWARGDAGEDGEGSEKTAAKQELPDLDWATEEEPEAGEGGDGREGREGGTENPENSQSKTDPAGKA